MKKFYTTLLTMVALMLTTLAAKADKVGDIFTLPGSYTLTLGDDYDSDRTKQDVEIKVNIVSNGDEYTMIENGTSYFLSEIPLEYNASTHKVTIKKKLGEVCFFPFTYDWGTECQDSYEVNFNPETGTIDFPSRDFGFCWIPQEQVGWSWPDFIRQYDVKGAVQNENDSEEDPEWKDLGNAIFVDGWVLPFLGIDQTQAENQYEVALQQNRDNENLYRLVNPYKTGPAAEHNIHSTKEGYIVFDVSDPDHVVFDKAEAGFAYYDSFWGSRRFNNLYCYNQLGSYIQRYTTSPLATIISMMTMQGMPFTTFDAEAKIVTLGNNGQSGYDLIYDANCGTPDNPNGGTNWQDVEDDHFLNMTAKIIFPDAIPEGPADEPTEGDITGNMVVQADMDQGFGDGTNLGDPQSYDVTASYNEETHELTIYNFAELNPITFTINDFATGDATAAVADKVSSVEEDDDYSLTYYYASYSDNHETITAKIYNAGEGVTKMYVDPWGEAMPEYDYFFNALYLVTEVTLNRTIPGLTATESSDEPSAIESIKAQDNGEEVHYFNFQGIEVAKPAVGTIVIKVVGNKATKVVIK